MGHTKRTTAAKSGRATSTSTSLPDGGASRGRVGSAERGGDSRGAKKATKQGKLKGRPPQGGKGVKQGRGRGGKVTAR